MLLDLQRAHDLREDRHAAREHRRAIRRRARELELVDAPRFDHRRDDASTRVEAHAGLDEAELVRDVAALRARCPTSRSRGPAEPPERRGDRTQLEPRGEPRAREALLAEPPVVEMLLAEPDAADRQALEMLRLVAFADDELRAAAADVDDEVRPPSAVSVWCETPR